jgi:peroxiredoxin
MKRLQISDCKLQIAVVTDRICNLKSAICNRKNLWEAFLALILLVSIPTCAHAGPAELQGTVTVSGSRVEIQVRTPDGRPAAGVNLRLLYGRQQTVAVAPTDDRGRWVHQVDQTGLYEAIVETGSEVLRLPFTVLSAPAPVKFPWFILVPCLLCLGDAGFLLVLGFRNPPRAGPGRSLLLFMAALLVLAAGLMGWSVWYEWHRTIPAAPLGPDLAKEAREFLRKRQVKPLSGALEKVLAAAEKERVETKPHPLLGKTAPDFQLFDHRQQPWRLSELLAKGPVVLVFYYGYHCNHCVGQLFALNDDIQKFRELGAQVVTISADPPELTQDRFRQYGEFNFPVLSDPDNKIAQVYGVYQPATGKTPEDLQHGTFVIDRDGKVHWTHHGNYPFTDNGTLLYELARLMKSEW